MQKGMKARKIVLFAIFVLLSVGIGAAAPEKGEVAPDFVLPSINGGSLKLSDFKGKVVIIDFWSTRCPPCRKGIPEFAKLYSAFKDRGLVVVGISLDRSIDTARAFCERAGVRYPVVMGDRKIAGDYGGIRFIPTTFIVDREMNITDKFIGYTPYSVFETKIKELLENVKDNSSADKK